MNTERIRYLTRKAQIGVIAEDERNELSVLLGCKSEEFQGPGGLNMLIGLGLASIAAAIITRMVMGDEG